MNILPSLTTNFSLLRGVHSPFVLCRRAKELGYSTVAITDRNNLYGLPGFLKACAYHGVRPVIGAEITHSNEKESVLLYAHGSEGYTSLCRIITEKHCNKDFNLIKTVLANRAGLSVVTEFIPLIKQLDKSIPIYYRINSLRKPNKDIFSNNIPALVIPQSVFITADDFVIHRLLRAVGNNTSLSRLDSEELYPQDAVLRSWREIANRFAVFTDALERTILLFNTIISKTDFGSPVMPVCTSEQYAQEQLRAKSFEGAGVRYGTVDSKVKARLEYELELICSKGFASYFLVVDDIVRQSPRTCGRGSGAASCVAYCLGITNVDPIRYNLMFERFLNKGRIDPPDIDVDFAWDERDGVLEYVFKKYGSGHAAMVANHLTFQPRMAMREVARVYGLSESEISTVTKRFPYFYQMSTSGFSITEVLENHPRTKHIPLDPPWPEIIEKAQKLVGIPRGIGTHCGGVVITPQPICNHAPVQYSAKGYQIIHWEKDGAEDMGLVKIDLLGNRSLAVIRDAIASVKRQGFIFDEKRWQPDLDPRAVDLLAKGKSMGVFYVESPAMRLLQQKTGYGDFEHMVIHSSIIRPAANKYINEYIKRLRGAAYILEHPLLGTVLAETYGIMVYQEDVSKVAMALAGFDAVEADALRKIMSKKDRHLKMEHFREKFFTGAIARGVAVSSIEMIWQMCLSFTGYSFCKPHSASYVQVSFQSAWLKAYYPCSFMAAVISNYGGFYTTQAYISETMRLGIMVLQPDVNFSADKFEADDRRKQIRVGLCQIKGLSENARKIVILERQAHGLYSSMHDLLQRTEIEERDAERLIMAGACDCLEPRHNRSNLFWMMRSFYRTGKSCVTPELKPYPQIDLLRAEYKMLGFLTVRHPITLINRRHAGAVSKINAIPRSIGKNVSFYGWCVTAKTVMTRLGDPMQFVTFEDETGICESVLFPEAYTKFVRYLMRQEAFLVCGRVMEEFGAVTVEVKKVDPV